MTFVVSFLPVSTVIVMYAIVVSFIRLFFLLVFLVIMVKHVLSFSFILIMFTTDSGLPVIIFAVVGYAMVVAFQQRMFIRVCFVSNVLF